MFYDWQVIVFGENYKLSKIWNMLLSVIDQEKEVKMRNSESDKWLKIRYILLTYWNLILIKYTII